LNGFLGRLLEELVAINGSDGDVADLCASEKTQRDSNASVAKRPHLPVEVSEPFHRLSIHLENEGAYLDHRFEHLLGRLFSKHGGTVRVKKKATLITSQILFIGLLLRLFHPFFIAVPDSLQFFRSPADLLCLDGLEILQNGETILVAEQGFTPNHILYN